MINNKSSEPLISIGMPVFNGASFIEKALESLLSQTYKNLELIISDNCSTDSTYSICEEAMRVDSRVRLFKQVENIGPLNNFEFVLNNASGQYFMWAAHDDIWDTNWLSLAVAGFESNAVMVTSEIIGIDDFCNQISMPLRFEFKGNFILRLARYFLIPEWHGKANIIYSLMRTEAAKKYKFPKIIGFYGFDMHFVFFLLNKGSCIFIEGKSLYKRVPKLDYQSYSLMNLENILILIKRNLRYVFTYINIAEGLLGKLIIISLMPIKLITICWYILKSLARRLL